MTDSLNTNMLGVKDVVKTNILRAVKSLYGLDLADVYVEHPANEAWGDYATNVAMSLAKTVHQSPKEIAKNLSYEINTNMTTMRILDKDVPVFDSVTSTDSGFVNIQLSLVWLKYILTMVNSAPDTYGSSTLGGGKRILIEYSQPNPNKPMHVGHARNNFLGSSLSAIYKFLGYDVIRANYMNDWGTHICKSMLMYQKFGNGMEPNIKSDHFVGNFYIMYEQQIIDHPEYAEELSEMFRKLEAKDSETMVLWKKIVDWVYAGWKTTYEQEGVMFDTWMFQHDYTDSGKEIVKIALEKGIAERDETGAIIARLEKFDMPDKVLLRSDGTSIYSTQDLQLAKDSFEKYKLDKRFYVVDNRQSDYFRQIFKILEVLGFEWAKNLYHVSYGVVSLPQGNMSSRTGVVVNADEAFEKLKEFEQTEIKGSIKEIENIDSVIDKIALGAFIYGLLKVDPKQDLVFDYSLVTKFEGNSGPYLMYTFARANSILTKSGYVFDGDKDMYSVFANTAVEDKDLNLLRFLYRFQEAVEDSAVKLAPSVLCNYLYELCHRFNTFYSGSSILNAPDDVKAFKLQLVSATSNVLDIGLKLLGITPVEKM